MKPLLKFIFNVLRNISLVLVILFFCVAYYFEKNPEQAEKWLGETSEEVIYQKGDEQEDFDADLVSLQSFEIPESNRSIKKLTIPTKEGTAYLRPSQIMYIEADTLVTTNLQKIALPSSLALNRLDSILAVNGDSYFFRTKTAILNCQYVMQIIRVKGKGYSYQNYAVMEDDMRINLSDDKAKELKTLLEKLLI